MKLKNINIFLIIFFCIIQNNFLNAKINNSIIVKVGNEIITAHDVENEVKTILMLQGLTLNQENINKVQNFAVQTLIRNSIKENEIKKYNEESYNKIDLEKYLKRVSKSLNIEVFDLEEYFDLRGINYTSFVERYKNELKWNTLIFKLYKNQISLNTVEIENELLIKIDEVKKNNTNQKLDLEKMKDAIILKKKLEKLKLFSRTHFTTVESNTLINFE